MPNHDRSIPLTDEDEMPFGEHKFKKMKAVPARYLDFIDGQPWISQWPAVRDYIKKNRRSINQDLERHDRR